MRTILTTGAFLGFVALASPARSAGFIIPEQAASATGRGTAVVAEQDDSSAIYYNPANIAFLHGLEVYAGANGVVPIAEFDSAANPSTKTKAHDQFIILPNIYASYRASDLIAAGIGLTTPFGLRLQWPASSPGRTLVRREDLRVFFISPVVALNLDTWVPGLAAAAGIDLVPSSVFLARDLLFGSSVGKVELGGTAFGVGARAGVAYRLPMVPGLSAGISYRAPVKLNYSGTADIDIDPIFRGQLPPDGKAKTSITMPQQLSFGAAYRPSPLPGLLVEIDGNWIGWSSFHELTLTFPGGSRTTIPRNWHDTWVLRTGAQYEWQDMAIRAGYIYDPTPIPATTLDFILPDHNRNVLTLGLGYRYPRVVVDVSLLWAISGERRTSAEPFRPVVKGTFDASAFLFALNLGYRSSP